MSGRIDERRTRAIASKAAEEAAIAAQEAEAKAFIKGRQDEGRQDEGEERGAEMESSTSSLSGEPVAPFFPCKFELIVSVQRSQC